MSQEYIELSRRLIRLKHWRWMPGMLRQDGYRYVGSGVWSRYGGAADLLTALHMPEQYPDLTDPATLGCVLALVREAWGMPTGITVGYSDDEALWGVSWSGATHGGWCGRGKTEAEALVVAMENAP